MVTTVIKTRKTSLVFFAFVVSCPFPLASPSFSVVLCLNFHLGVGVYLFLYHLFRDRGYLFF